jgi:membrane protein implicated in regulation of membrane protease activity
MGHVYLAALVAALGVLGVQIVMAGHGGHQGDVGHAGHAHGDQGNGGTAGFWTVVLSLRFWTFTALGFGMSGTLLHFVASSTPPPVILAVAVAAGLASGVFAALVFRAVRSASAGTETRASLAVGRVGRVVVPCGRDVRGQVRIEIAGSSVDLVATTDEDAIARGEAVLVEDLREGVAHVSKRPGELG